MKNLTVWVGKNRSIWTIDFDNIEVDAGEGKIYCSRAIESDRKTYWIDCAVNYEVDVEFSDDNLDVFVSIDIDRVKSISNVEP